MVKRILLGELTEALEGLLSAQADKAAFLEGALDIEEVTDWIEDPANGVVDPENPELAEIEEAVDEVYEAAIVDLNGEMAGIGTIQAARSDAYNSALIAERQSVIDDRVEEAEKAVNETEGLAKASASLASAQSALTTAYETQVSTTADVQGEVAKFDALGVKLNNDDVAAINLAVDSDYTTFESAVLAKSEGTLADEAVLLTDSTASETVVWFKDNKVQVTDAYKDVEGIDAVVAAVQADITALKRVDTAQASVVTAIEGVLDIENEGWDAAEAATIEASTVNIVDSDSGSVASETIYKDASDNYFVYDGSTNYYEATVTDEGTETVTVTYASTESSPRTDGSGLTEVTTADEFTYESSPAVPAKTGADYFSADDSALDDGTYLTGQFATEAEKSAELSAAKAELESFSKVLADYQTAKQAADQLDELNTTIDDLVEAIEEDFEVSIADGTAGTAEDDVFIFEGESAEITSFGAQGEDVLYIGGDYNEVRLEAGVNLEATRQGDASVQDLFIQQVGSDTVISLEGETFEGNATNGFEGSVVTLAGVDASTVQYENGQISIVEVA
ncbi:hypothetical protein [Vreelandella aquamarina]|uniref:hypothetical protein n=1 Tax=Vreelandella aquamarina TaxID=77097 RepID=UPI0038513237